VEIRKLVAIYRGAVDALARFRDDASGSRIDPAPDSLMTRINSLFSENGFPVMDELIPCSAAQGISGDPYRKLLNS
jgi:hypothetical protein